MRVWDHVWAITAECVHPIYGACHVTEYYAAPTYEAAKRAFIESRGEWQVVQCNGMAVTVWDVTERSVAS